ncbi:MAG: DNA polymerase III subunit epsilon [Alphaproteobacteria bacterium]
MTREIVLDTETTGLDPLTGDRVVEIGCLELVNHMPTGQTYHVYLNPQRDMPTAAFNVHGLSEEFLSDKPLFAEVADDFAAFVGTDVLIAHNAPFDIGFLNAELERAGQPIIPMNRVKDTLAMARKKFPGAQNNLDALCRRFEIDTSARTLHGALLDAGLLADVYLELVGGRQPGLTLAVESSKQITQAAKSVARPPRHFEPSAEEQAAHDAFIREQVKQALWLADAET